jgi:hypothetical protein
MGNLVPSMTRTIYNYTASSPSYTLTPGVYTALPGYYCDLYQTPISSTSNGTAAGCVSVCSEFYQATLQPLLPSTSFLFVFR